MSRVYKYGQDATICYQQDHFLSLSYVCVFKLCTDRRLGCIKCYYLHLHNHRQTTHSHYLEIKDFIKYIKEKVNCQIQQYNINEKLLKELSKLDQNEKLIKKTVESLQHTQDLHMENFKQSEYIWSPDLLYFLDDRVFDNWVDIRIFDLYSENKELLSQIEQKGLYVNQSQTQIQNQQFTMEEKILTKQLKGYIHILKQSPNGRYIACVSNKTLKILKLNSYKQISCKIFRMGDRMEFSFSNDSQFYFYCDRIFIYFQQIKTSQKRIFGQIRVYRNIIFPLNKQEILIQAEKLSGYFKIIRIQNRYVRKELINVNVDELERITGVEYDDYNRVIIFGTKGEIRNKICFQYQDSGLPIFKKQVQKNEIMKLLKANNQLILGNWEFHQLYAIDYQKKGLYLLNRFSSGYFQQLNTIFYFRYPIIMGKSGIMILDECLNQIQYIEFQQEMDKEMIQSSILVCTKSNLFKEILILDKIQMVKFEAFLRKKK